MCAGMDWLEMLVCFPSLSYVYIRSLKINNSNFHYFEKMFFFVALNDSVHENLAISRHFTVNMHAECKYYILNYAIKSHYFETDTDVVLLNMREHTVNSCFTDRKAGLQVMLCSNIYIRNGKQHSAKNKYGCSTARDKSSFKSKNDWLTKDF